MITLNGWGQNWTVYKTNNDTIISFNFNKNELKDLRLYVTKLEIYPSLYNLEVKKSSAKDSLLHIKDLRILERDSTLNKLNTFIEIQNSELTQTQKINKKLQDKYNKQKILKPYLMGASFLVGLISWALVR